jgi:hypothetical protein
VRSGYCVSVLELRLLYLGEELSYYIGAGAEEVGEH